MAVELVIAGNSWQVASSSSASQVSIKVNGTWMRSRSALVCGNHSQNGAIWQCLCSLPAERSGLWVDLHKQHSVCLFVWFKSFVHPPTHPSIHVCIAFLCRSIHGVAEQQQLQQQCGSPSESRPVSTQSCKSASGAPRCESKDQGGAYVNSGVLNWLGCV